MANNIEIIYKIQKGKVVENNIRGYIRKKGIWILFGKKTEGYECLNVAKSKNIGNEVLYDISCMQNLNYEEGAKKYINEFGEYFGLKYKEGIVQEYSYSYIKLQKYEILLFMFVCDENDEKKEEIFAWRMHARYWRGSHRPFEKEMKNYYSQNFVSKIGTYPCCTFWNNECEIFAFLKEDE